MSDIKESLKIWEKYGEYVLMASPYQDRVLASARGSTVTDVDGQTMIDMEAGQICSILGHNNPKLIDRIVAQTKAMLHHGTLFLSEPIFEAAAKMAEITPGNLKKSIFLSTGAEANECAFRIAKAFTGRSSIVGFDRGYAGLTLATMAAGGNSDDGSFAVPGTVKMLTPDCKRCPVRSQYPGCNFLCLESSERFINAHARGGVAAFIVEPILSSGGMIYPPPGYFKRLKALAKSLGALLIADEAQTGMGRTGTWFGMDHDGVVPDILVFSKGVGGGFPASGVIVTDEVAEGVLAEFSNFSSHQSDPVAAVAISCVIDIIREEGLLKRVVDAGARLHSGLEAQSAKHKVLGEIRSSGLMVAATAQELPALGMSAEDTGRAIEHLCRESGVHLKGILGGKVFRILPPLTISDQEIDKVLQVFEQASLTILAGGARGLKTASRNPYTRGLEEARAQKLTLGRAIRKAWNSSPAELVGKVARRFEQKG